MPAKATQQTMRERILAVAPEVLRRFTVSKFGMEDVARAAGIARQTIYKHFAGRDDLLVAMLVDDMRGRQIELMNEVTGRPPSAENLVEIIMTERKVGAQYPLFSEMLDASVAPRMAEMIFSSEPIMRAREETWLPILHRYIDAGVIKPGLDCRAAVRWITYQMFWLMVHPNVLCDDETALRGYVRQFMVAAFLRDSIGEANDDRSADERLPG